MAEDRRKFLVTTWEHVEVLYDVLAANEAEARKKFKPVPGRLINPDGVEQISSRAFAVQVESVDEEMP